MNQTTRQSDQKNFSPLTDDDPRCREIRRVAEGLFAEGVDWVDFFRRVLGTEGIVRQTFPGQRELQQFEQTGVYLDIQQWLAGLRMSQPAALSEQEPTRVITVRLPQSVHEMLRIEAYQHCTSMNKLCISKLVQFIEGNLVPNERLRFGELRDANGQATSSEPAK